MKNGKKLEITVNGKTIAETEWSKTPLVMETEKESDNWKKIVGDVKTASIPTNSFTDKLPFNE